MVGKYKLEVKAVMCAPDQLRAKFRHPIPGIMTSKIAYLRALVKRLSKSLASQPLINKDK